MSEHEREYYVEDSRLGYRHCVSCGRSHVKEHLVDGWCPQCLQDEPEPISERQRAQEKLSLFRSTAKVLREIGHPERAEWYEDQIPGLEERAK